MVNVKSLRQFVRSAWSNPVFSLFLLTTIAITIAATSVILSVVSAVLLDPLPYARPDQIVAIQAQSARGFSHPSSYLEFLEWRRSSRSFSDLAAYAPLASINLDPGTGPTAVQELSASDNLFQLLGVPPVLGRTFVRGEEQPGKNDVAILSNEVWRRYFQSSPAVIGRKVLIGGQPYTVIGVMPARFRFPINATDAVYVPLHPTEQQRAKSNYWLLTIGRLKYGLTLQSARAEMAQVASQVSATYPEFSGERIALVGFLQFSIGDTASVLHLLLWALLVLLAIGCLNIAGLFVARGFKREHEIAVRLAVGARPAQIIRQIVLEGVGYGVAGALAGIVLGTFLLDLTRNLLSSALVRGADIHLNVSTIAVCICVAGFVTFIAGLTPALRLATHTELTALRESRSVGGRQIQRRFRAVLVVSQICLSILLLTLALATFAALRKLQTVDFGFPPDHVLTVEVNVSGERQRGHDLVREFYNPLLARIENLPGVQAAGLIQMLPIQNWGWTTQVHVIGAPVAAGSAGKPSEYRIVSPGYYEVFKMRLLQGRFFDERIDTPTSQPVVVVNRAFLKAFLPGGQDPIGRRLDDDDKSVIIGVVSDVRQNIYEQPMPETDYVMSQIPGPETGRVVSRMYLAVRSNLPDGSLAASLRAAFRQTDPTVPFRAPQDMRQVISGVLILRSIETWAFSTFGFVALLLAVVGLYGLVAHEVHLSTRDIGLRLALGATRSRILGEVYRRVAILLGTGCVAGVALASLTQRQIQQVTSTTGGSNFFYVLAVAFVLMLAGFAAAVPPALNATRADPNAILRSI